MRAIVLAALGLLAAGPLAAQGVAPAQGTAPAQGATQAAPAGSSAPQAADLLFEKPNWGAAPAGITLAYRYTRAGGDGALGAPIDDRIKLGLAAGEGAASRTVRVDMLSGPNRRAAGPFESVEGNPVLVLFLEHHLENVAKSLKANPRYLKNRIRAGLRERAETTPTTVSVGGREIPGWRVEAKPFTDDAQKERMRGLDALTYTFVTSEAVPGEIVSIEAKAAAPDGGVLLQETLTYDPAG
jgi:hypothetical protein